jgi:hypothetical protein
VANAGKSSWYANEIAYVRIVTDAPSYEAITTGDHLRKVATNVPEATVEDVVFANTATASLTGNPDGAVSWEWIGGVTPRGATPIFNGVNIDVRQRVIGLLRCTYNILGDRWEVTNYTPEEVAVVAHIPNYPDSAYLTITFEEDPGTTGETYDAYDLKVVDYCTDLPVPGVSINFDGSDIGVTGSDGKIFLGALAPDTYPLVMTKAGYLDSNIDRLHNDSIVIASTSSSSSSSSISI